MSSNPYVARMRVAPNSLNRARFHMSSTEVGCNKDSPVDVLGPVPRIVLEFTKEDVPFFVHDGIVFRHRVLVEVLVERAPVLPPPRAVGHDREAPVESTPVLL